VRGMTIRLIAFSDHARWPECTRALCSLCAEAIPASVAVVLRDKERSYQERLFWGRQLKAAALSAGQTFLASERMDLARSLGSDGVHIGAAGLRPTQVKRLHSGTILRAWHGFSELLAEERAQVDSLLVSPVCAPRKGREALGLIEFATQARTLRAEHPRLRIYALGGIDSTNAAACREAGADGVAVIGAAMDASSRAALLSALCIQRGARVY
jgi:thiamine-phosphate pyrophosphorylase